MANTLWIVGGSGDIGRAIGREFGGRGWNVWLSARGPDRLDDAAVELRTAGVDVETHRLDAGDASQVRAGVDRLAGATDRVDVLVYNVSPQHDPDEPRLDGYLRHTVGGFAAAVDALTDAGLGPTHAVVPTSSKGRDPGAVSPAYHASKQALIGYLRGVAAERETTGTVLWLGKRETEAGWRWLRPPEMAARAWESSVERPDELLVGDRY